MGKVWVIGLQFGSLHNFGPLHTTPSPSRFKLDVSFLFLINKFFSCRLISLTGQPGLPDI